MCRFQPSLGHNQHHCLFPAKAVRRTVAFTMADTSGAAHPMPEQPAIDVDAPICIRSLGGRVSTIVAHECNVLEQPVDCGLAGRE